MASQTLAIVVIVGYLIIEGLTDPAYNDPYKKFLERDESDLFVVGTYIAAHKYFGVDFRYITGQPEPSDMTFYRKFPTPVLRDMDTDLSKACESSAVTCLNAVRQAAQNSGSLQHIFKNANGSLPSFAPFDSNYASFKFRQTAMYYLCWHTLLKSPKFNVKKNKSCLKFLSGVDEIPLTTRDVLFQEKNRPILDIRDSDHKYDLLTCAKLWFCPDPCYGRKSGGNFTNPTFKVPGNPCIELRNSECKWKHNANTNFEDLIKNKFNITCECELARKGFEWNSQFGLCVDKDECVDGTADCPSYQICKNDVGSYLCTCPRGYQSKDNNCERIAALQQSATLMKYTPDENRNDDGDLITDIMDFIGLSSGKSIRMSVYFITIMALNSLIFWFK